MPVIIGPKFLFGKLDPKPAKGFPSNVVEFIIAKEEFVVAKCEGKTYVVKDTGEHWEPAQEIGLVLPSLGELLEKWYEGSAYGDHVPKELPKLIVDFLQEHGMRVITEESAWEIISETTAEQSWWKLFECIFAEGAKYATMAIEDRGFLRTA